MTRPMKRTLLAMAALSLLSACSSSSTAPATAAANRTWRGVIGATGAQGTFDLTSTGTADARPLTGSAKFGVTTTPMTGTFTVSTGAVIATGGAYTMTATVSGTRLQGTYTGAGNGSLAGNEAATPGDIKLYCGTYTETVGGAATRYWSFSLAGTSISGTAATSTTPIRLVGSVTAGPVTFGTVTGQSAAITSPDAVTVGSLAVGAVSATNAAGTFNNGGGTSGTWSGAICP